jgi:predicted SnoaL-like aldol condensation-catalyzing enzyme
MTKQRFGRRWFGCLALVAGLWGCAASEGGVEGTERGSDAAVVDRAEANAALVVSAYEQVLNQRDTKALEAMFAEDYIQHNPTVADGREGLANYVAYLRTLPEATSVIKRVIAQGDLVVLHVHATETAAQRGNEFAGLAIVDIFRVANGKIVEHWDVIQAVPETSASGHSMFDGGGLAPGAAR